MHEKQLVLTQSQLEAIGAALADTSEGLTGSEIGHLLASCRMADPSPDMTKRHRLYNAFAESQNSRQNRREILEFIRQAMRPERFAKYPGRLEPVRTNLNRALSFAGLAVDAAGTLSSGELTRTLSESVWEVFRWLILRMRRLSMAIWVMASETSIRAS